MTGPPNVAIIGAGPAGLTLASLFYSSKFFNKIHLTIFERDTSPTSRPDQGGSLDLHTDTGLAAIHKRGLWEGFLKYARFEGEELIIADKNATKLVHKGGRKRPHQYGNPSDRPEIDRKKLKEIFLNSLPMDMIQWGHHLRKVTEDGKLKFDCKKDFLGLFDLIIGADGAWSRVRARLTEVEPTYSGVSGFEMIIREASKTCPQVDQIMGRGGYVALSDCKFLSAQRMGDDSLEVRSWNVLPEGQKAG